MSSKALILINTGTPDAPDRKSVGRFLTAFLNDKRVIDLPWLWRKILVNLIIVPFRKGKSTALYRKLWTDKGSPIRFHTLSLVKKLNEKTGDNVTVFYAMRYGNPSVKQVLDKILENMPQEITVLPVFPQYASSTTGSVAEHVMSVIKPWPIVPEVKIIEQFHDHHAFINAFAKRVRSYNPEKFDHILFTYHGLPLSHLRKTHPLVDPEECNCTTQMPPHGKLCYKAACYETTRLLVAELGLAEGSYSTSFQSRLTNKWITPFTDQELDKLYHEGKRKVLVVAPSFVTDCLETIVEIAMEYGEHFRDKGGELVLVDSLNDSDEWVESIIKITDL